MLNYNLNINSPLQQEKKNEDVRPPFYWSFESYASASDSSNLPELGFATMSINAINTNCIQVSNDANGLFTTDAQSQVTASLTGSNWPTTGSTTMSLNTFGISYDPVTANQFFSASFSASAAQIVANPNITASKLENLIVSASEFVRYYVEGKILHTKGNIWNPKVNYKVDVTSPSASYVSSSFLILKNSPNVNVVTQIYTTASNSGVIDYAYCFNMSASFSGAADFWNSSYNFRECTMSLVIPELGKTQSSTYTNANLTASWVATDNNPYNITASVELKPWLPFPVEIIAIGGGGAGGGSNTKLNSGGGGGAGAVVSASWLIPVLTSFDITIGAGGTCPTGSFSGSSGGDTTVYWNNVSSSILIAKGGSGGTAFGQSSLDGGSTGGTVGGVGGTGTVATNTIPANSSYALTPTGNIGDNGHQYRSDTPVPFSNLGGGGGGALTKGQKGLAYGGGAGGSGINLATFGLGTLANGGSGGSYSPFGGMSNGANASANTGDGGGGALGGGAGSAINVRGGNGGSGIVVIRYPGPQIATGGIVSQSLNYTTHTFTSNGTFSPTANFQCCLPENIVVEYLVVGGGGSGAGVVPSAGNQGAGGGAGGTVRVGSIPLPESGNVFPVVVGLGAQTGSTASSNGLQGGTSSIFGVTSTGGTGGTNSGTGQGGSNAIYSGGTQFGPGGAGGGQNGSNGGVNFGGNGGNGYQWFDGVYYAAGAEGEWTPGGGTIYGGTNGLGYANPGSGGEGIINGGTPPVIGQKAGKNGIVIIRYNGNTQKATGGTIRYEGGYVYHTFTSSANLNVSY